jgi:hypothetical protein
MRQSEMQRERIAASGATVTRWARGRLSHLRRRSVARYDATMMAASRPRAWLSGVPWADLPLPSQS